MSGYLNIGFVIWTLFGFVLDAVLVCCSRILYPVFVVSRFESRRGRNTKCNRSFDDRLALSLLPQRQWIPTRHARVQSRHTHHT